MIKLALLGRGTYFGEEEMLLNIPRHTKAVVVSATAEIYKCPKEKFFAYVKTMHNLQLLKDDIKIKNEWREKYVSTIKEINNFLQKQTKTPPYSYKTQVSQCKTPSPQNKSFKRQRIASYVDQKLDLTSIEVLEKLHKRLNNMLKIKKAINNKTDREKCEENSQFLNSMLEDRNKRFSIVSCPISGNKRKLIGVVRDIFQKRGKSMFEKPRKPEKKETKARSLSINDISFGDFVRVENVGKNKKNPEFVNGRKIKQRLFKVLKYKTINSSLVCNEINN